MALAQPLTMQDIYEHCEKELAFFESVQPFDDASMEAFRANAVTIAKEAFLYATNARLQFGAETYPTKVVADHLMQEQYVRLRDPDNKPLGVVTAREILSAKPVDPEPEL